MTLRWKSFLATVIAVAGGSAIYVTITRLEPDTLTIGLLLALLLITVAAAAIPVSAAVNNRFARADWFSADPNRLWRHAGESGLLAVILAYLQLKHTLNWVAALLFLVAFVVVESFFITRVE
ncbi:MAG TPA: hypothetical protein ENJ48_02700 [Anaerolineae bacterium]|nr:hypothetical protein [Anaerolineae bacterium]